MKKKILFITILFITIRLSADEKILNEFILKINKENTWIPIEYLDVINSKNRDTIKSIVPDYNYEKEWDEVGDCWKEWYERYVEYYEIESIWFNDTVWYLSGQKINQLQINKEWDYIIKSVTKQDYYILSLKQTLNSIYNSRELDAYITNVESLRKAPLFKNDKSYYTDSSQKHYYKYDEIIIDAKFIFDGDYLTVYANEDKFKQVYFKCTEETYNQLKSLIYTNSIDLSKVTWPRHADGSCDYDVSKTATTTQTAKTNSSTNVTKNKTMHVAENLKLRSGEATSTQVLTVISAGTKVKILELGKVETIDGINSNWVKIEVLADAKDRDGKTIKKGTVGWCYGGYLK